MVILETVIFYSKGLYVMEELLKIIAVCKQYDQKEVLKKVTFTINKGEIVSLLGINGAGKSTLSNILCGFRKCSSGDILYQGNSIYADINEYKKIVGYCPQRPNLNNYMTLGDNLYFSGEAFGLAKEKIKENIAYLSNMLAIKEYLASYDGVLSGGFRQRFMIARSLMHNPKFLILDEPTVGMDPDIRRNLWDVIKELKKEGMTILLTTHYLDEAETLSDRVCFLHNGSIELIDTPKNLLHTFKQKNLEDAFVEFLKENKKDQ